MRMHFAWGPGGGGLKLQTAPKPHHPLKLLHTADIHLGRHLYGRRRHHEFAAFLDWLAATLDAEHIDALVIAGDIFDTATPSPRSQAQYYQFLCRIAAGNCRHIIITAGNHDSPAFLDAPRDILRALNVHVIGAAREPADEVLLLRDRDGAPEAIICAVPYLRERDLRTADAGESLAEKAGKLLDGIRAHYTAAVAHAETLRAAHGADLPLIATGHLYTAGGQTSEAHDHEIGTLTHVPASAFPAAIDYLALGHIHLAQRLDSNETRRYSGSPLPHTFAEAAQNKTVCLVTFQGRSAAVRPLVVPDFQKRARLRGDLPALEAQISELAATGDNIWLEIHYEGEAVEGGLRDRLHALTADTPLEILRLKNERIRERVLAQNTDSETLDDLNPLDVFERCLAAHHIPADQRDALRQNYREILAGLDDDRPQ